MIKKIKEIFHELPKQAIAMYIAIMFFTVIGIIHLTLREIIFLLLIEFLVINQETLHRRIVEQLDPVREFTEKIGQAQEDIKNSVEEIKL